MSHTTMRVPKGRTAARAAGVLLRMSREERDALDRRAADAGLTRTDYVRRAIGLGDDQPELPMTG